MNLFEKTFNEHNLNLEWLCQLDILNAIKHQQYLDEIPSQRASTLSSIVKSEETLASSHEVYERGLLRIKASQSIFSSLSCSCHAPPIGQCQNA
jgi:hypothetical protein